MPSALSAVDTSAMLFARRSCAVFSSVGTESVVDKAWRVDCGERLLRSGSSSWVKNQDLRSGERDEERE